MSRRVWRQHQKFASILKVLINDVDKYNCAEAERLEMILKQIFDFNLFSKVMKEHLDR